MKTDNIQYGKVIQSTTLDDLNSQKIVTTNIYGGNHKTTTRYEIRSKVMNKTEELAEYVRFSKEGKTKAEFRTEPASSGKGYFIIKCWEE